MSTETGCVAQGIRREMEANKELVREAQSFPLAGSAPLMNARTLTQKPKPL